MDVEARNLHGVRNQAKKDVAIMIGVPSRHV